MQVGQLATVNLQMAPSTVSETLTVTGEAPLINTTMSTAAANIDQRQMQELPLNGRNGLDLTLLAPGSRANTGGETPIPRLQVAFQINMDGQQVTNSVAGAGFGQPRFSRDSITQFEFITNRFDATQGRSMGVVVNAVTKSGTNTSSGTFSGYFRDSDWATKDHVLEVFNLLDHSKTSVRSPRTWTPSCTARPSTTPTRPTRHSWGSGSRSSCSSGHR